MHMSSESTSRSATRIVQVLLLLVGALMVVYAFSDHLHQALAPIVADNRAVYRSTHELTPASDSSNFVKDGHFIAAKEQLIGRKLVELINTRLNRR